MSILQVVGQRTLKFRFYVSINFSTLCSDEVCVHTAINCRDHNFGVLLRCPCAVPRLQTLNNTYGSRQEEPKHFLIYHYITWLKGFGLIFI